MNEAWTSSEGARMLLEPSLISLVFISLTEKHSRNTML